jgi:transforming growth factor-beta-induced protein
MLRKLSAFLAVVALAVGLMPGVASADEVEEADESIAEVASSMKDLRSLLQAVKAAQMSRDLIGLDDVTVFAPTNAAFRATANDFGLSVPDLINGLNDEGLLDDVILYHIVPGVLMSGDVIGFVGEVGTLQGENISVDGNSLTLNGNVRLNLGGLDIEASNGVIHKIQRVLIPPSFGA